MALPPVNPDVPGREPGHERTRRPRADGARSWPRWRGRRWSLALSRVPACVRIVTGARASCGGRPASSCSALAVGLARGGRPSRVRGGSPPSPAPPLRRGLGVPGGRRPVLHPAAARLRGRAALPADGPEPLARARPRPARQPRARGLARVHAGPDRAALRRARARTAGRTRPTAPACRCCWRRSTRWAAGALCVVALTLAAAALALEVWRSARRLTGDDEAGAPGLGRGRWCRPSRSTPSRSTPRCRPPSPSRSSLRLLLTRPGVGRAPRSRPSSRRALPWLHLKMLPAAVGAGPGRGLCACADARAAAFFGGGRGHGPSASSPTTARSSASPRPSPIYGGVPAGCRRLAAARARRASLLDRSFGLLPYAPVFLLALAGLGRLVRLRAWERSCWSRAAVAAPVLPWRMWWGGQCPPARFLVPLVPLLALALAARVALSRTGLARWRWPLALLGARHHDRHDRPAGRAAAAQPRRPPDAPVGRALRASGRSATYLPSLVSAIAGRWRVAVVWLVGAGRPPGLDAWRAPSTIASIGCSGAGAADRPDARRSGSPSTPGLGGRRPKARRPSPRRSLRNDGARRGRSSAGPPDLITESQLPALLVRAHLVGVARRQRQLEDLLDRRDEVDLQVVRARSPGCPP